MMCSLVTTSSSTSTKMIVPREVSKIHGLNLRVRIVCPFALFFFPHLGARCPRQGCSKSCEVFCTFRQICRQRKGLQPSGTHFLKSDGLRQARPKRNKDHIGHIRERVLYSDLKSACCEHPSNNRSQGTNNRSQGTNNRSQGTHRRGLTIDR